MPAPQYVRGSPSATRTTIRRSRRDQKGHAHRSHPHPLHELIRTLITNLSVLLCHPFPIPLNIEFTLYQLPVSKTIDHFVLSPPI